MHQVPCEHCSSEFGRLATALRTAEVTQHRIEDLLNQLETARGEIIRLAALAQQLEADNLLLKHPG